MVAVSELQPLWGQFRNLPYQAISARLADVQPAQGDWKPEDTVWFNGRVADKQFVSVVKAVEGTGEEPLVVLSLVDTSHPSEDRFIAQELIQVHCISRQTKQCRVAMASVVDNIDLFCFES